MIVPSEHRHRRPQGLAVDLATELLKPRVKATEEDVDPELSHGRVVVKNVVDCLGLSCSPAINFLEDCYEFGVITGQWTSILTGIKGLLIQFEEASCIGAVVEGPADGVPYFLGRREADESLHQGRGHGIN